MLEKVLIDGSLNLEVSYMSSDIFDPIIDSTSETFKIDFYSILSILVVIVILLAVIFAATLIKKILYEPFKEKNFFSSNVSNRKIKSVIPTLDIESFKKYVFNTFKTFLESFSNFNYDNLKKLLNEKVYEEKVSELETLKKRNLKNVISNITEIYNQINNVENINGYEQINVVLTTSHKDYLTNINNTDIIISGSKRDTTHSTYLISFTKGQNNNICPKCGGEIVNNKCLYCRNILENNSDWIISKIKLLKEKKISK